MASFATGSSQSHGRITDIGGIVLAGHLEPLVYTLAEKISTLPARMFSLSAS